MLYRAGGTLGRDTVGEGGLCGLGNGAIELASLAGLFEEASGVLEPGVGLRLLLRFPLGAA
jgi:hypothetical protein